MIKGFEEGDLLEMAVTPPFAKEPIYKMYTVVEVYPYILLCIDRKGRKRTFNYADLVVNGYTPRMLG